MQSHQTSSEAATLASRFVNNTNRHVFLTGKAGTGKTTFLRRIITQTFKNAVIAAPTGIAAINAGGVTLHSLFQLPFGAFVPDNSVNAGEFTRINTPKSLLSGLQLNATKRKLLQNLELIIIDEVSMLRADLLDAIDLVLRTVRRNPKTFGGVQLLFIGDLLQLPPVVKEDEWRILRNYYPSVYFFDAVALRSSPPLYLELDKIYRQADEKFIAILNNLRSGKVTAEDAAVLNKYYRPGIKAGYNDGYIQLTTHNHKAESLNKEALSLLAGPSYYYKAEINDEFSESAYPIEQTIELKKGAQVMFIKNDTAQEKRYYNGKIGFVTQLSKEGIEVSFPDGSAAVSVERHLWENIRYETDPQTNEIREKVIGTFSQYPLKLAWAITVHKSQGLTFDKAIIDIGSAFAPGQVYVALSRLRSLDGLILSSEISLNSIRQDDAIKNFSSSGSNIEELGRMYEKAEQEFFRDYLSECFNMTSLRNELIRHLEHYSKEEGKSVRQKHKAWALQLRDDFLKVEEHAGKFVGQLRNIFQSDDRPAERSRERVIAAAAYFEPLLREFSSRIKNKLSELEQEKRVKQFYTELAELEASVYKQLQQILKARTMVNLAGTGEEFVKEKLNTAGEDELRKSEPSRKPEKKPKLPKEKKPDTKKMSLELYKAGKSVEEIATERGLSPITVEGHLAHFVSLGMLSPEPFVSPDKMQQVIEVSNRLETTLFSPIRQALGDDFSYSEIRFAMSYYQNSNKKSTGTAQDPES